MAKAKEVLTDISQFQIFQTNASNTGERVAVNLSTGVAVRHAGGREVSILLPSSRVDVITDKTLEELVGHPAPEESDS